METSQAKHTPHAEETNDGRDDTGGRLFDCVQELLAGSTRY